MPRFSCVLLVDPRGWLLLQERDEHAPIAPEKWGFVGGHVDEGEEFEPAAYRELEEETGVRLDEGLELFAEFKVFHEHTGTTDPFQLFVMKTDLTDDDIVVGEGRQIVFVAPDEALDLDLTESALVALPGFLDSNVYRRLAS